MRKSICLHTQPQQTNRAIDRFMKLWLLTTLRIRKLQRKLLALNNFKEVVLLNGFKSDDGFQNPTVRQSVITLTDYTNELIAKLTQTQVFLENKIFTYERYQRVIRNQITHSSLQLGSGLYRVRNTELYDITGTDLDRELNYRHELEDEKEYELPDFKTVPTRRVFEYVKRRFGTN
jgi:hypothetical protein